MKAPLLSLVALVAVAFSGVAQAGPGPTSPLYLTTAGGSFGFIIVIQGNTQTEGILTAYGQYEFPIAVSGDVRTTGSLTGDQGGQYTLGLTPTGTRYFLPSPIIWALDSTSDGSHNYLVDTDTGIVYQTARDFTHPKALPFPTLPVGSIGITYDPDNHSLWISNCCTNPTIADYSFNGTLLSSFSPVSDQDSALAFDPADHTLWLDDAKTSNLEQYSTAGKLLSVGPSVPFSPGGEFNLAPATPEPGSLILVGSGIIGLAGILRRKISL